MIEYSLDMDHGMLRLYTVVPMQPLKIMQKSIGIEPTGKLKLNSKKYWNNPKKRVSQKEEKNKK